MSNRCNQKKVKSNKQEIDMGLTKLQYHFLQGVLRCSTDHFLYNKEQNQVFSNIECNVQIISGGPCQLKHNNNNNNNAEFI